MSDFEVLETRQVHAGKVVDLRVERVRLPNGSVAELEIVRHQGAAAVVPVFDDRSTILLRQYRHAGGGWLLEIPAGKLDDGEDPRRCAERELEEETGWVPASLQDLGWIFTTPGFTDERIWLFLATGLKEGRQELQEHEVIETRRLPLEDAVRMALSGEITDAKTICALLRTAARLGL